MNKKSRGFTLIELLAVVAILAFLLVLGFWAYSIQLAKARDAKRKADMHLIQNAVEEYEKDHDCYPPEANVKCDTVVFSEIGDGLTPYLRKIPCDILSGESYPYEPGGPVSCSNWYRMYALLETGEFTVVGPGGVNYDYYVSSPNAPTPVPVATPTSAPGPTSSPPPGPYWGCFNGSCNPASGPPYCSPKFGSGTCYGQCKNWKGESINDCK